MLSRTEVLARPVHFGDTRLPERFWNKVQPCPMSGCWLFVGATTGVGYGSIKIGDRIRNAHRVAYEVLVGTVADGLQIDHRCRTRCCVNPAHLEAVTNRENSIRGAAPSVVLFRENVCAAGHDMGQTAVPKPGGGRQCRVCHCARRRERNANRSVTSGTAVRQ